MPLDKALEYAPLAQTVRLQGPSKIVSDRWSDSPLLCALLCGGFHETDIQLRRHRRSLFSWLLEQRLSPACLPVITSSRSRFPVPCSVTLLALTIGGKWPACLSIQWASSTVSWGTTASSRPSIFPVRLRSQAAEAAPAGSITAAISPVFTAEKMDSSMVFCARAQPGAIRTMTRAASPFSPASTIPLRSRLKVYSSSWEVCNPRVYSDGFVLKHGQFTPVDHPKASHSRAWGLSFFSLATPARLQATTSLRTTP